MEFLNKALRTYFWIVSLSENTTERKLIFRIRFQVSLQNTNFLVFTLSHCTPCTVYLRYSQNLVSFRKVFVNFEFSFEFRYLNYILYIEDTHQISFGSGNSFKSYCVHGQEPSTDRQTDGQRGRHTDIFVLFLSSKTHKTRTFIKWGLFFILAITIISFFITPYAIRT